MTPLKPKDIIFMLINAIAIAFGIATFLLVGTSRANADARKWTTEEKVLEGVAVGLKWIDYRQTRYIAKHPERFYEHGVAVFFIGDHPSVQAVDNFFVPSIVLHPVVTHALHYLPEKVDVFGLFKFNPVRAWQTVSIGVSANYVICNFAIDIKMD